MAKRAIQMQKRNNGVNPSPGTSPQVERGDEERPVIAWHRLSIMESLELAELEDEAGEMGILAQVLSMGQATPRQVARLLELRSPTYQRGKIRERMATMARYVQSVPRSWLVDNAPEVLDFTDPKSFEYLRSSKFRALYQMLMFGAETTESITGN